MAGRDRQKWDAIYQVKADQPYPPPDPLLLQFTPPAPRPFTVTKSSRDVSRALDLAGGLGQNALWLASQGYMVDLIDISRIALVRAQAEAARRAHETNSDVPDIVRGINFIQADLDSPALERDTYDVVCVFRYLDRSLFPTIRAAVRPGGRVIYETFNTRVLNENPDFNPDYALAVGELAGVFADWRGIFNCEPPERSTAQVVAIKPEN